jgi:dienelactone hydrolase
MRGLLLGGLVLAAVSVAEAKIVTEAVPYKDGDVELEGYLVYDDAINGPRPAVIVVHEWWGLNDFAKQKTREIAALGYVGFAIDMYGKGKVTDDAGQAGTWARALYGDTTMWRQRAKAGYDALLKRGQVDRRHIGAIGFCFGGATVQQMAWSGMDLKGVVSFHGSLVPPTAAEAKQTKARVLILHGAVDTLTSQEEFNKFVDAMKGTDIDWQLNLYSGAKHSFTNPDSDKRGMSAIGYNEHAAKRSWRAMKDFFKEAFGK